MTKGFWTERKRALHEKAKRSSSFSWTCGAKFWVTYKFPWTFKAEVIESQSHLGWKRARRWSSSGDNPALPCSPCPSVPCAQVCGSLFFPTSQVEPLSTFVCFSPSNLQVMHLLQRIGCGLWWGEGMTRRLEAFPGSWNAPLVAVPRGKQWMKSPHNGGSNFLIQY